MVSRNRHVFNQHAEPAGGGAAPSQEFALTPQQRLYWQQHDADGTSGKRGLAFLLESPLDSDSFAAALQQLIDRHEILRCLYPLTDAGPVARILAHAAPQLVQVDVSGLGLDALRARVAESLQAPLELGQHAPFRWTLFLRDGKHAALSLQTHAVACDQASLAALITELGAIYHSLCANQPLELAPITHSLAATLTQRNADHSAQQTKLKAFWDQELAGELAVLNFQTDKPRPPVLPPLVEVLRWALPSPLSIGLRKLAGKSEHGLYDLMLSATQVFLHRYTGQGEVLVAAVDQADGAGLLGPFEHLFPCRGLFSGRNESLKDYSAAQHKALQKIRQHQAYPWASILADRGTSESDTSRMPMCQARFQWVQQNPGLVQAKDTTETWRAGGLVLLRLAVGPENSRFDLTFRVISNGDDLILEHEYNSALYQPATIKRMAANFHTLLNAMVEHPEAPLGQLEVLAPAERDELIFGRNQTKADYPRERCFYHLFEDHARRNPDKIAVIAGSDRISYGELNERANQVAHFLRAEGLGNENFVGVCMHRSVNMMVALIGILKAGAAYVPLDPAFPEDRLEYMVDDSQLRVLFTEDGLAEKIKNHSARVLHLDKEWSTISQNSKTNPKVPTDPACRAYVIYTSGSTGKPKGVQISHLAFQNFIISMAEKPGIQASDIWLSVTTLSFDICGLELWGPMISGATIVLASKEVTIDGPRLLDLLLSCGATIMQATPVSWRLMLGAGWQPGRPLKMLCGGEPMPPELADQLVDRGELWNMYGPTETTVWSTLHRLASGKLPVSIGKPIANTDVFLIDSHFQLAPIGGAGELIIGGEGLARGYHNRPDLTALQFVPNPYTGIPGDRMYKTGDLARWLPSAALECFGRIDHQVKVRGFRIELGEIESAIIQHESVKQVVVIVREDSPGDKMLVAYVKTHDDAKLDVGAVRTFIREFLPEYMVPSAFVQMEVYPLTPNGKIDKKSLPAPDWSKIDLGGEYVAPRTEQEEVLASIWSQVLRVPKLSVKDSFYDYGGNSLHAVQLINRVREAFRVELPQNRFYKQPTIEGMSHLIDELRSMGGEVELSTPIHRVSFEGAPKLSANQHSLWYIDQLQPGNAAYNVPTILRLRGRLNQTAMKQALELVVARHDALRTCLVSQGDDVVQLISPSLKFEVEQVDLSAQNLDQGEAEAIAQATLHGLTPFNLARAPLFRFTLYTLADHGYILLINFHHTIYDGWSTGVFLREFLAAYQHFASGSELGLHELPIQYADYSHWMRNWQQKSREKERAFWKNALEGAQLVLELPRDKPRPPEQTYVGALQKVEISEELSKGLREMGRSMQATLFVTLQTAFSVFLSRYTGLSDILVGTPMANRGHAETEDLIGYFVNTTVLRSNLEGDPSFREMLARVRDSFSEMLGHQGFPFDGVVELLKPERDASRNPIFQVMFILHNNPLPKLESADFTMEIIDVDRGFSQFDLTLVLTDDGSGLHGGFEYNTSLFDAKTAARMAANFSQLLAASVSEPDQKVGYLTMVCPSEQKHLLDTLNATAADYPKDKCFYQLFEEVAARRPQATAVMFEDQQDTALTYAQLEMRANQVANYLRAKGVGLESFVGLCTYRSSEMLVGLLGILKAGGAYVPLDPGFPQDRLAYMLEDSGLKVLITEEKLKDYLGEHSAHVVRLDTDWPQIAKSATTAPQFRHISSARAYEIYTSGSTGKPKGVQISHQAFLNFALSMAKTPGIAQDDILLAVTTLSFDICGLELWVPLMVGAQIVLASKETASDGQRLLALLLSSGATVMQATPISWRLMLGAGWNRGRHLKMMCGGEPLPPELAQSMLERGELWNMYGPTETTVWSTIHPIKPEEFPISIGKPIDNTDIYIIDKHGQLVPFGAAGELLIGGDGLARGYHDRPSLTAQQFVPNPFSKQPGDRMYKTGDLARYMPNSLLECLGRIDFQVKIRGFRIELGEIESAMVKHPLVKQVVVLVREDAPGNKMLVAYTVSEDGSTLDVGAVREFMRTDLPEYMIPSVFVQMESYPLTPNGKINKKALPAPDMNREDLSGKYVAPRTPREEMLCEIWATILQMGRVGISDNFFELGGHSLLASQIVSRIRSSFQVEVPLTKFLLEPTVAALAELVDQLSGADPALKPPPITRHIFDGPPELSLSQERLWFIDQMLPDSAAYSIPFTYKVRGMVDPAVLEKALEHVVSRHDALRTHFETRKGRSVQIISENATVHLEQIDLSSYPEESREAESIRMAVIQGLRPFKLAQAPLFRFTLMKLSADNHIFLLNMHHTISDGWSIGVFMREMMTSYDAIRSGHKPQLKQLPIQFADFAVWQKNWLQGEVLERETEFWRKALEGAQTVLELPGDRQRPKIQTYDGAMVELDLDAALMERLKEIGRGNSTTIFMMFHAVFNLFLYRYTGHHDLLVGTPMANRSHGEVEDLIGFFVNTLVLRTQIEPQAKFTDLLQHVRGQVLETFAHQDFPFERLIELFSIERDLSRNPLFQVMFVLNNNPMPDMKTADFEMTFLPVERGMAHFDLTLELVETNGQLSGIFEYNTNLFDRSTAGRMAGNFMTLLRSIAANPDQSIGMIPLLTAEERKLTLVDWNHNAVEIPELCPFMMFEQLAASQPDAPAIYFKEDMLTYAQVNSRVNRLAQRLRAMGVGPDTLVGISQERTPNMTISMLGIQKSGGAYVPLDPKHPEERIQYIMEEARVSVIITQQHLAEKLAAQAADLVIIDNPDSLGEEFPDYNPDYVSGMENLSHVIYTSGSTGKPKGVAINHRPVTQLVIWTRELFTSDERDCMLASTSMNFDLSVYENIATLALGGTIVLVENALYLPMDPHKHLVRTINTVPSAIKELLRQKSIPTNVTTVNLAGEQLKESVVWDLYALPHIERVYNLYGPSEDTTYSTWALMERDRDYTVKIGVPLNCTQAYILDANFQPLPVGVPGELLLAGIGLARGYLNRPDLTEERFLPNPFSKDPDTADHGPIMYRTGDLVRWRPNGQLECLGRIDHQVKIRGFRIELGEIEAIMQKHEHVHEVVVMDRDNQFGEKYLAGYVTLHHAGSATEQQVRAYVAEHLPEYMVPAYIVILDAMPLNPNGKIDRKKLPEPSLSLPVASAPVAPSNDLEHAIAEVWKEVLGIEKVGSNSQFFEIGGNSLNATRMRFRLEEVLGREVKITDIFQYPTVAALAQYLDPDGERTKVLAREKRSGSETQDIAVIGMALKVPGADDVQRFWDNICKGVESITEFSDEELLANGVDPDLVEDDFYVKRAFIIHDVDQFDAVFFGMSPLEARITDPQQRIFLEKAWEALESAGYNPETYGGRIGVFAGVSASYYLRKNLVPNHKLMETVGSYGIAFATEKDYMATRIAFKFNLKGPAMAVQTACSTGLMTIHSACRSLIDGESDMALAGSACIWLPTRRGYLYAEGGTTSPVGQCRPFDHRAKGMVDGSGVCVVLLKRVEDALADGDHIMAVVKGSASNNDGFEKVGFTAPSIEGQAIAIADAQSMAGIHPDTITYVEAHGTGTSLGDPIEVAALTRAFSSQTDNKQYCALGSVKANIGHLDTAAGAAGFIKAVLCLHHAQIPPSINFEAPNPAIDFAQTPFYVNTELRDWQPNGPRRAACSAFGIGGTNIHAILEEAPQRKPAGPEKAAQLLVLSARTQSACDQMRANLADHLEQSSENALADVAYTLQVGRKPFNHRHMLVASSREQAIKALREPDAKLSLQREVHRSEQAQIVFMFSGQGSQYPDMGLGLYQREPAFRDVVDACSVKLKPHLGLDLRKLIYPNTEDEAEKKAAAARMEQTSITQPALFVIEYATAKLLMSWGIQPQAMIGHSIGEYVAATLSGVLDLDAVLGLVAARGRLMQAQPSGSMMALSMSEEDALPYLNERIQVATINAPKRCVVAGPDEALTELSARLEKDGKRGSMLHTSHAFHSAMMDPALPPFLSELRSVQLRSPSIPYVSNVTGTWITAEQATDPEYYARHLRNAVRFSAGLDTLFEGEPKVFIEVGPGKTLMTFAKQQAGRDSVHLAFNTLRHPKDGDEDNTFITTTVGQLWANGLNVDWTAYHGDALRYRVPLPTYPFERKSHWVDAPTQAALSVARTVAAPVEEAAPKQSAVQSRSPQRKHNPSEWFYQPLWKQTPAAPLFEFHKMTRGQDTWLIFVDACGLGQQLVSRLNSANQKVITVGIGEWYSKNAEGGYSINPGRPEDYTDLFADLRADGRIPKRIVHLWNVTSGRDFQSRSAFSERCREQGFLSLVHLAQAYEALGVNDLLHIGVVSNNMQEVNDGDLTMPEKATLLGACKVIPREYANIDIRSIDVVIPPNEKTRQVLVDQLLGELALTSSDTMIAYRGRRRWLQTYEPATLGPVTPSTDRLRKGGVYLITGGFGGIGTVLSTHLAKEFGARLILVGRTPIPGRRDWENWLSRHSAQDPTSVRIQYLIDLEKLGAKVLAISADVAQAKAMQQVVLSAEREFGRINGVIHAAGVAPSGPIRNLTRANCENVLGPKVNGTLVLDELFRERELDFMLLLSSTSSILGHHGNADYCAGNTFLDAFAHHNTHYGFNTVTVNSDAWSEAGMAAKDQKATDLSLSVKEGLEGLRRVLAGDLYSQIVLSPRDLIAELEKVHAFEMEHIAEEDEPTVTPVAAAPTVALERAEPPRVQVSAPAPQKAVPPTPVAPVAAAPKPVETSSDTVLKVKALWEESLGIPNIGLQEDFTEIGGDSLLASVVASRMRRTFKVPVSPDLFNEAPTISGMARAIDKLLHQDGKAPAPAASAEPVSPPVAAAPAPAPELPKPVVSDDGDEEFEL